MRGEQSYRDLVTKVMLTGFERPDRTGTGTKALFGQTIRADLRDMRIPMLTTKKLPFKILYGELLWMISGGTNVKPLQERGIHIWDAWADEEGELGPVYGAQWRRWQSFDYWGRMVEVDQLRFAIEGLERDPFGRRHIVTAWNPAMVDDMALPPCPTMFQFLVDDNKGLHCVLTQRSADLFLGVPFDMAEYALLTYMVGRLTGLNPRSLTMNFGDAHLYLNHLGQAAELLSRGMRLEPWIMWTDYPRTIDDFGPDSIRLGGYDPHPTIKGKVAV